MSRVFAEIPFGQVKRGVFSQEFRLDEQNAARFCGNFVWTSKMPRVFAEISFEQGKRGTFSQEFRLDEQNVARFHGNFV